MAGQGEGEGECCPDRKVWMGTTGWTDPTLARCGRFFPASSRTAEDRLRYYSTQFPCVEVDSSNYAIPTKASICRWLGCVPKGFLFHFKVFGFFCSKSCPYGALPYQIKNQIKCPADSTVQLSSLSAEQKAELWQIFNDALVPVYKAGALGVVVFQFHLTFKPSDEHRKHVMWCRHSLDARFPMAVEFRSRDWFNQENAAATTQWLTDNQIALVAADELEHETYLKGRFSDSPVVAILPIAWACTDPSYMYIRLHRREGTDRVLTSSELSTWEDRLKNKLPDNLKGPVYFLWGTIWEDQAVTNARNLSQKLGDLVLDWKSKYLAASKSTLQNFFKTSSGGKNVQKQFTHVGSEAGAREEERDECCADHKDATSGGGGTALLNQSDHDGGDGGTDGVPEHGDDKWTKPEGGVLEADSGAHALSGKPDSGSGAATGSDQELHGRPSVVKQTHAAPTVTSKSKKKRKENPNLKSSSITSFFKRAT